MKNSINLFRDKKDAGEKIAVLTAYDYTTASLLEKSGIDAILVGDSLSMVFQGNNDTLPVTLDEMIYHCKAVRKGAQNTFLIADMPFLSYNVSIHETVQNAGRFVKESGAQAVKLEGGIEIVPQIEALLKAKIPVMGHLGLTPQSVNAFGGFKVQGKTYDAARQIVNDALLLEKTGVFAIVLEGVPEKLAALISSKLRIPTIGIGAGPGTDGQVLVINDIFGNYGELVPKFVKVFADVGETMNRAISTYIDEVKSVKFPDKSHVFSIQDDVISALHEEFKDK